MRALIHLCAMCLAITMLTGCNVASDPPPRKMPFLPKVIDPSCPPTRGMTDQQRGFRLPNRCQQGNEEEEPEGLDQK